VAVPIESELPTAMMRWRGSLGLVTSVAGRSHDHDPSIPRLFDGKGQRVDPEPLRRVRTVRDVENSDVHAIVIAVLDDPVDRRDHLRDVRSSVGGRNLDAHDARIWGHAAVGGRGCLRVRGGEPGIPTGDEAGHERAVAEGVEVGQVGRLGLERQVGPVDDLAG
jgi:hypothetical protein